MNYLLMNKSLKNKLWIALLVSFVGLSACSNESEETVSTDTASTDTTSVNDTNTETSEITPVQTMDNDESFKAPAVEDTEDEDAEAYYSGVGGTEDEEKAVESVTVNQNNSNLDKTAADGLQ